MPYIVIFTIFHDDIPKRCTLITAVT